MNRSNSLGRAAGVLLAGVSIGHAHAQNYPQRPVRMIIPNTAGAAGAIGHEIAAKAPADGYAIILSTSAGLVLKPLLEKPNYDPVRDFAPISLRVISPQMLVSFPGLAARTVDELVAVARAIALAGTKRSPAAPEVPTVAETIPGFQCVTWYALLAPRNTPAAIVSRLNAEVVKLFADSQFAQRIADTGQQPQTSTPEGLLAHMREESDRWSKVIRAAGIKPER